MGQRSLQEYSERIQTAKKVMLDLRIEAEGYMGSFVQCLVQNGPNSNIYYGVICRVSIECGTITIRTLDNGEKPISINSSKITVIRTSEFEDLFKDYGVHL